jgi:hypothetical protein
MPVLPLTSSASADSNVPVTEARRLYVSAREPKI